MGRSSRRDHDQDRNEQALLFALGAVGGVALGYVLSRGLPAPPEPVRQAGARLRDAARTWGPARLRRGARDEHEQVRLEDAVLDLFLHDAVLSERGIDVGCISRGIVELSGTVRTTAEAERAVRTARTVAGVETVVNRIEVEHAGPYRRPPAGTTEWEGHMAGEWTGRGVGMGQRRQGEQTDPGADDSQHTREAALDDADRAQYEDEELAHKHPVMSARPGHGDAEERTRYDEDELNNQDPYGKHAVPVPEQPQALHSQSRVGEGLAPGTELEIEGSDVPVKPHSDGWHGSRARESDEG